MVALKIAGRGFLPGTYRSYLGSLNKFVEFVIREKTVPWAGKFYLPCTIKKPQLHAVHQEVTGKSDWEILENDLKNRISIDRPFNSEYLYASKRLLSKPLRLPERPKSWSLHQFNTIRVS